MMKKPAMIGGAFAVLTARLTLGAPSQEDVFKSISDNVSDSNVSSAQFGAFMIAVVGLVLLIIVVSKWRARPQRAKPRGLNHPGRLMKEILKHTPLRPAEVRQLKAMAEADSLSSPLTYLLCPSLLEKAVRGRTARADRKVLGGLVRKVSVASK